MPVFVNPTTGERYENVPAEEVTRAESDYGLVPLEKYEKDKAYEAKPIVDKAADTAKAGVYGLARGVNTAVAPLMGDDPENKALQAELYSPQALEDRERHSTTAAITENLPIAAAGAGLGAAGVGVRAALGIGAAEDIASSISQEAIDATTQNRGMTADNVASNFLVGSVFNLLGFGIGGGFAGKRNLLAEFDKEAVPVASAGARVGRKGAAESAGAASADFADDMWDDALRSVRDEVDGAPKAAGKATRGETAFLADPDNYESLTGLAAHNITDNFDQVRKIVKEDIGEATRVADVKHAARNWTPDNVARQDAWVRDVLIPQAEDLAGVVSSAAKAAKKSAGAGFEAGGFSSQAIKDLLAGAHRMRSTQGPERLMAIINTKRAVDRTISGATRAADQGGAKQLIEVLRPYADDVRKGIRSDAMFGQAAPVLGATDDAWHSVIESLSRVEGEISEKLGHTWGEVGQAAVNKRTNVGAVKRVLQTSAVDAKSINDDLAGTLSGLDQLAEARASHGLTRLDHIPRMQQGLQEIRQDLNMGGMLRVARLAAQRQGSSVAGAAVDLAAGAIGGRLPLVGSVVSKGIRGAAEKLLHAPTLPRPNTAVGKALQSRLKAYSRSSDLGDTGYSSELPAWLRDQLRRHGGQVAGAGALAGTGIALEGQADAAEADQLVHPEKAANRDAFRQKLATMAPEDQTVEAHTADILSRVNAQTQSRVNKAVADLFVSAVDPSKQPTRSGKTIQLERRAEKLGVTRAVARFMGRKTDDIFEAFESKREMLNGIMLNPAKLASTMAQNLGDMPRLQPEMFGKLVAHTFRTAVYLQQRRPGNSGKSMLNPEGYPPTEDEINEWAGHWVGALHPLDTIEDLAANDLQPEQIEAVKANWAETYAMFQQSAISHIHLLAARGQDISQQAMEQIDTALSLNGAGDPLLSWQWAATIEQASAQVTQQAQATGAPPSASFDFKTPESLESSSLATLHDKDAA